MCWKRRSLCDSGHNRHRDDHLPAAVKDEPRVAVGDAGLFSPSWSFCRPTPTLSSTIADSPGQPDCHAAGIPAYRLPAIFINAMAMHFIPQRIAHKIAPWGLRRLLLLGDLHDHPALSLPVGGVCARRGRTLCGPKLLLGFRQLAHRVGTCRPIPSATLFNHTPVARLPHLHARGLHRASSSTGRGRMTMYHLLAGPVLSHILTNNIKRMAGGSGACYPFGILLIVVKTPLRGILYVKTWWLWPKAKKTARIKAKEKDAPMKFFVDTADISPRSRIWAATRPCSTASTTNPSLVQQVGRERISIRADRGTSARPVKGPVSAEVAADRLPHDAQGRPAPRENREKKTSP